MKYFIIFAGPNGSGKSSIKSLLQTIPIQAAHHKISLNDFVYINADYITKTSRIISQMPEGNDKNKAAWQETERRRDETLSQGKNCIWETVFSDKRRLDVMKNARAGGYYIIVIYVTTVSPEINVARVHNRVKQGGHDVPIDKILSRYEKATKLLPEILISADEAYVYDNSSAQPELTFCKENRTTILDKVLRTSKTSNVNSIYLQIDSKTLEPKQREWRERNIIYPLEERGYLVHRNYE